MPQRSYPDMITQTIHIGDCGLLERWIDLKVLQGDPKWTDWRSRTEIEGLNAIHGFENDFLALLPPGFPLGSSECIDGWRGLSPLALNPHFGTAPGISLPDRLSTERTHYADAVNIYGVADDGFAASTWDNVGVQYGVEALRSGFLTVDEFLDLNANVGSWKNEPEMVQEGRPFLSCPDPADLAGLPPFPDIHPTRHPSERDRSVELAEHGALARRRRHPRAAQGGGSRRDRGGLRTRPRESRRRPDPADRRPGRPRRRARRPLYDPDAALRDFAHRGRGPITGDVFKRERIPVDDAFAEGLYGGVSFDAAQRARLEGIFPTGVCDYAQGDARRP